MSPLPTARALASELGAEYLIDPTSQDVVKAAMDITNGLGYDVVLDCSGSPRAVGPLLPITAKCGTLIYGAQYPNDFELPFNISRYCYFNEITVTGVMVAPLRLSPCRPAAAPPEPQAPDQQGL